MTYPGFDAGRLKAVLFVALFAGALAACGGGGGSSGTAPPPSAGPPPSPPPPPPEPSGIGFNLEGSASKGIILGGSVRVVDANDPEMLLTSGTTSTADGSFDISVAPSLGFNGGILKITVSGNPTATMVCDAPRGCGASRFGSTIPIDEDFRLTALVESPENGRSLTVYVNALTTFAARYTEDMAAGRTINPIDITGGEERVAHLFGLPQIRLSSIANIDITQTEAGDEPSEYVLRAAMVNAGILSAMLQTSGTPAERISAVLQDFSANRGQLPAKKSTGSGNAFDLENIFLGAFEGASQSPLTSPSKENVAAHLERDYLASAAAQPGTLTSNLPERPLLTASEVELSFEAVSLQAPQGLPLTISGDGVPWTIWSNVPWLTFDRSNGTGNTTVMVTPHLGYASIGLNQGSFVISDNQSPRQITVNVALFRQDALRANLSDPIRLNAIAGSTAPLTAEVHLTGQNVTWQAVSDQPWARARPATGTAPSNLEVNIDPTGLAAGAHSAEIVVSDTAFDQQVRLPVELILEPRRITVAETGVSFSEFPGRSVLERDIFVSENLGSAADWTARSSASWLNVTPSGQTGWVLTLRADPAGLATDTVHTAQVQISATDEAIANTETIEVSLWVGTDDPEPRIDINLAHADIVADPVRPYIYVSRGLSRDVDVINVHTGQTEATIRDVTTNSTAMAVTPDGRRLFVVDGNNWSIVPVDLETRAVLPGWTVPVTYSLSVGRIDGKNILFTGSSQAYDADTGKLLLNTYGQWFYANDNSLSVSRNGERMCMINRGISPYALYCFDASYSHHDAGTLTLINNGGVPHGTGSDGQDVALSNDGNRVYVASGANYHFKVFNTKTMQQIQELPADAYPNAAEVDINDIFYGGISRYYGQPDIWAYDSLGNLRATYGSKGEESGNLSPRKLMISGDGTRLMGSSESVYSVIGRLFILSVQ